MRLTQRSNLTGCFSPNARRGVTLIEVMIAIFILAIGLMGAMAMLPLGAAQMKKAVQDERTAHLAATSDGMFRIMWRAATIDSNPLDSGTFGLLNPDQQLFMVEPALMALDDATIASYNAYYAPYYTSAATSYYFQYLAGATNLPPPNSSTPTPATTAALGIASAFVTSSGAYSANAVSTFPSYPVFIDPIGYAAQTGSLKYEVGGLDLGGVSILPRRSINAIASIANTNPGFGISAELRFCTNLDDISFLNNGLAGTPAERAGRYNAAFLIQRLKNNVRQEINLKVVTYENRPLDSPLGEHLIGMATPSPNTDFVSLVPNAGLPNPRKGSWILLANTPPGSNEAFADFYRVVGFNPTGTTWNFSVSPPIRDHANGGSYSAYVLILDNVVEVFDRGTITPFALPGR